MPKRKKSATALFEVMSAGRRLEPIVKTRGFFQSPNLFQMFKRPPREGVPVAVEFPRVVREPEPAYIPPPPPVEAYEPPRKVREPRKPREPSQWLNKLKGLSFKLDPLNSVIAVSGVVIVVGLTLLVLHKFSHVPMPTMSAVTTTDLKKQPAKPGVMDLTGRPAAAGMAALPPEPATSAGEDTAPKSTVPGKRIVNMNYVMIQAYTDEKVTREAADMLNKNGVECTVVQGLAHYSASSRWFCVVGTKPFPPRMSESSDYRSYLQKIRDISTQFAGKTKWKQFNPQPYRWQADSEKP